MKQGARVPSGDMTAGRRADSDVPQVAEPARRALRLLCDEPIVLKDVGHFLMIEDPAQFNPVLDATLATFSS